MSFNSNTTAAIVDVHGIKARGQAGELAAPAALPPAPDLAPFEERIREALQPIAAARRQDELIRTLAGVVRDVGTQLAVLQTLAVKSAASRGSAK